MRQVCGFFVSLACFAAVCFAVPAPVSHIVHEKRDFISPKWVKRGRLYSESTLPVRIGLTQSNLHLGHEYLMDV